MLFQLVFESSERNDGVGQWKDSGPRRLIFLKEVQEQHNCKATGYWKTNSVKYHFLLIAHEYLFVFHK